MQPGLRLPACSHAAAKAKLTPGLQKRARATPSPNNASAPQRVLQSNCLSKAEQLWGAQHSFSHGKALSGQRTDRVLAAGGGRRCGRPLPVQVEGGDLRVVPLEVNEVEKVLGSLFLAFLPGREQGGEANRAQQCRQAAVWAAGRQPGCKVVAQGRCTRGQPVCSGMAGVWPCWCQGHRVELQCLVPRPGPKAPGAEPGPLPAVPRSSACTLSRCQVGKGGRRADCGF